MSPGATVADRLSLTLPKPSELIRKRFKRPRRPTLMELMLAYIVVSNTIEAPLDYLRGYIVHAVLEAAKAGCCWVLYQHVRKGSNLHSAGWPYWTMWALIGASIYADAIHLR